MRNSNRTKRVNVKNPNQTRNPCSGFFQVWQFRRSANIYGDGDHPFTNGLATEEREVFLLTLRYRIVLKFQQSLRKKLKPSNLPRCIEPNGAELKTTNMRPEHEPNSNFLGLQSEPNP